MSVDFHDAYTGWVVGNKGTTLATNNGGVTWLARSCGANGTLLNGSDWRLLDNNMVEFTTDGGDTWQTEDASTYARYPAPWYYLGLLLVVGLIAPLARDSIS